MTDFELEDLSYSAQEEALAFGIDNGFFLRYFRSVRDKTIKSLDNTIGAEYDPETEEIRVVFGNE